MGVIQRNAIKSWLKAMPGCSVVLLGNEEGEAEAAKELGVVHNTEIKTNEFGTPLLDSVFNWAKKSSKDKFLVYANADIILLDNLFNVAQSVGFPNFLISGRRYDLDLKEVVNFEDSNWKDNIFNRVKNNEQRGFTSIDYFIFPKDLPLEMPSFTVGRPGWDNWFIFKMKKERIPVIDASPVIRAVHQNHNYAHSQFGKQTKLGGRVEGPELKRNFALAGGMINMLTLRDADLILEKDGLQKPKFPRIIFSTLSLFYFWRLFLVIKRKVIERLFS